MKICRKIPVIMAALLITVIVLAACGADQPNDISGTFENGKITYIFAQDGTMQQITDGVVRDGSYIADNGSLVIYYNDATEKFDYTYEGGKLGLYKKGMIFGSGFNKTAEGVATIGTGGPGIPVMDNETSEVTSEAVIENPTEKTTEQATEKSTESATEKSTEPATEKATEKATEPATEKATEKATEPATEKATEKATEPATEKPTEQPADRPTEPQTEQPADQPAEPASDQPAETPEETPTEPSREAPSEPAAASLPSVPGVIEGDIIQGSTVTFGRYEIDNDFNNGQEPIEWKVVYVEGNRALLVSRYALDCIHYDDWGDYATWQDCSLRYWLNNDFISTAFNDSERAYIADTELQPDENKVYGGLGVNIGGWTVDKVFILSASEMYYFFGSDYERKCTATWYAEARGAVHEYYEGDGYWSWLRTPGRRDGYTALLFPNGSVDYRGTYHTDGMVAVRPALCIEIN